MEEKINERYLRSDFHRIEIEGPDILTRIENEIDRSNYVNLHDTLDHLISTAQISSMFSTDKEKEIWLIPVPQSSVRSEGNEINFWFCTTQDPASQFVDVYTVVRYARNQLFPKQNDSTKYYVALSHNYETSCKK